MCAQALPFSARQNKSPASKTSTKQKNLSSDADIWKMPDIGQYIGRPLNTLEFIDTFLFLEVAYSTNIFSKILFTLSQTLPFYFFFALFKRFNRNYNN